ncbi:MAG: hypothetical protein L0387_37340 [Acidobacteria bacterium]|nr:hypothetical protein [Acidobacteriota bacterium]
MTKPLEDLISLFYGTGLEEILYLTGAGHYFGFFSFGRPEGNGSKARISCRFTNTCPLIKNVLIRWFLTSFAMACLVTPRMRAASACEIQSGG